MKTGRFATALLRHCMILGLMLSHASLLRAAPNVVVSIKPVHSLVAGVMQGIGEPALLIDGAQSPHQFSLRPSAMRRLQQADLVLWVGPDVEATMTRLFAKPVISGRVVALTDLQGLNWLPSREDSDWKPPRADYEGHAAGDHEHQQTIDSHIWLSPEIARGIVRQITELLCNLDTENVTRYRENSHRLMERLNQLDAELAVKLSSVRQVPFVVFHDAYHYFEQHYQLNAVGSVSISSERQPGMRHIHELRSTIVRLQARCLFSEPQFQPKLVETLIEGTQAKAGQLDPLGSRLNPGPEAYFQLMRQLADNLVSCLG